MTNEEPDEALLWAREQTKIVGLELVLANAYRAGAAASAERIKEIEARVKELERLLLEFCRASEGLNDHRGTSTRVRSLTLLWGADQ